MKFSSSVIMGIMVTEKSTMLAEKENKYFFKVHPDANKLEIKAAIEKGFKVKVDGVNTMKFEGKKKRERTMKYGVRPDWKKAVVTLKEGNKIELT